MRLTAHSLAQLSLPAEIERRYVSEICEWERVEYGEGKHRTPRALLDCALKNRTGFFILTRGLRLLGYADVWELTEDFYAKLKVGTAAEESLTQQYILARSDMRSGLWYIGSIITDPMLRREQPILGAFAFAAICNVLPRFFRQHSIFPAQVLGVGSSTFGRKLLTRWGFESVKADREAIDTRPRYEKRMQTSQDGESLCLGTDRRKTRIR